MSEPASPVLHALSERSLPPNWRWAKLGEVIAEAMSGFACGERDAKGVVQLRMNNVDTRGGLRWDDYIRVPADSRVIEKYAMRSGDVMFNNTNSTELVGKTALFNGHTESVVYSNHFTRLRVRPDRLDAGFLAWWLLQEWKNKTFEELCNRWIGQSAVNNEKLLSLAIPLPPLPEQKQIARVLNEQMAEVEKARKATEAQLGAAKSLPAAYLRRVFDSPEAKKWPRKPFGEVAEITASQVDPKVPEFGALPHVSGENIESGRCRLLPLKTASQDGMISGKYLFNTGDVLYSKLRPYLRKAAAVDFRGVCSADMYPIRVDRQVLEHHFVAWMLVSDSFTRYADSESRRARMPKLNREQLFAWEMPLPSLDTQKAVVSRLNVDMGGADRVEVGMEAQLSAVDRLPAALLRKAFRGGL